MKIDREVCSEVVTDKPITLINHNFTNLHANS